MSPGYLTLNHGPLLALFLQKARVVVSQSILV